MLGSNNMVLKDIAWVHPTVLPWTGLVLQGGGESSVTDTVLSEQVSWQCGSTVQWTLLQTHVGPSHLLGRD